MLSFKRSLIALVGILILVGSISALMPLVGRGQGGNPLTRDPRRLFYLTQTTHDGSQALSACATGYHMASLWEIHAVSNLKYNTQLGRKSEDSGLGPPMDFAGQGWVRTGDQADIDGVGSANCNVWTSEDHEFDGTTARLFPGDASAPEKKEGPWVLGALGCLASLPVWCVQD